MKPAIQPIKKSHDGLWLAICQSKAQRMNFSCQTEPKSSNPIEAVEALGICRSIAHTTSACSEDRGTDLTYQWPEEFWYPLLDYVILCHHHFNLDVCFLVKFPNLKDRFVVFFFFFLNSCCKAKAKKDIKPLAEPSSRLMGA